VDFFRVGEGETSLRSGIIDPELMTRILSGQKLIDCRLVLVREEATQKKVKGRRQGRGDGKKGGRAVIESAYRNKEPIIDQKGDQGTS